MKRDNTYTKSIIFSLLSMLLWGLTFVWYKIVFLYYKPITTIFLRLLISSLLLFSYLYVSKSFEKIHKSDRKKFLIMSFLQPFCYFMGESHGLQYVSSTVASIIISTIPLFTPFIGYFLLKEKITLNNMIGLIISTTGVITLLLSDNYENFYASLKGIIFLFLAVISALFYGFYLKKLSSKYSPLTIIAIQNLIGCFYFLPFFLIIDFNHFITVTPNYQLVSNLLFLSFFGSTLAYVLFTYSVKYIGITLSNIFANTIPVFTAIFSFIVLNETFSFLKITSILIVILGLIVSQYNKSLIS